VNNLCGKIVFCNSYVQHATRQIMVFAVITKLVSPCWHTEARSQVSGQFNILAIGGHMPQGTIITVLTSLWYNLTYSCKVCIWPKKPKNDNLHWKSWQRRMRTVAFTIDIIMACPHNDQNIYSWISYSIFQVSCDKSSPKESLVKGATEQGIDASLRNLWNYGKVR